MEEHINLQNIQPKQNRTRYRSTNLMSPTIKSRNINTAAGRGDKGACPGLRKMKKCNNSIS